MQQKECVSKISLHLLDTKQTLSIAESCTGGMVCQILTSYAGSSQWFDRGFITYSNQAKKEMLAVSAKTLQQYGAVSEEVVKEMLSGVLYHSQSHYALAISGIAGPGGAVAGKPVGTVCFGWAKKISTEIKVHTQTCYYSGNRQSVREQASQYSLEQLLQFL